MILQSRNSTGTTAERIEAAIRELEERRQSAEAVVKGAEELVAQEWSRAVEIVPGSKILAYVLQKHGCSFAKTKGDSGRLAMFLNKDAVPDELRRVLCQIAAV